MKTRASLTLANNQFDMNDVLVVCEEQVHIEGKGGWKEQCIEAGYSQPNYILYASLHKLDRRYKCIILDEADVITELRLSLLSNWKADKYIYLTGTPNKDKLALLKQLCLYKKHVVDINKAIELELVPEPTINIVEINLDNKIPNLIYKRKSDETCNFALRHKFPFRSVICTEYEYYSMLEEEKNNLKMSFFKSNEEWRRVKWIRQGLINKNWLSALKIKYAEELISLLPNKRAIVFVNSGSTAEADELGNSLHSKMKNSDIFNRISEFNGKKLDYMVCAKKLRRGMNLAELDYAIITQLDGSPDAVIQKIGRALRADEPVVYIFIFRGTVDEIYLTKLTDIYGKSSYYRRETFESLQNSIRV